MKPLGYGEDSLTHMNIEYIYPLSKAWARMKKALFRPFDIGKWFALGFCVFLARLLSGGSGGGGSSGGEDSTDSSDIGTAIDLPEIGHFLERVVDWIHAHPLWTTVILIVVLIFIGIILIFTWLSSRGAFMFLDNVVHDRALIIKPWREYKILSNSLFFWRIGFGIAFALLMLPFLALSYILIVWFSRGYSVLDNILGIAVIGLLWLLVSMTAGYVSLFTNSFVVPIMYKHNLRILQGWQMFLPILSSHSVHFILYGLFYLLLFIGIIIAAILFGCLTCCIGFILLILPYISSVVLLPAYFTLRAFSLEFLAQWGENYSVFPAAAPSIDDVPPPSDVHVSGT